MTTFIFNLIVCVVFSLLQSPDWRVRDLASGWLRTWPGQLVCLEGMTHRDPEVSMRCSIALGRTTLFLAAGYRAGDVTRALAMRTLTGWYQWKTEKDPVRMYEAKFWCAYPDRLLVLERCAFDTGLIRENVESPAWRYPKGKWGGEPVDEGLPYSTAACITACQLRYHGHPSAR